MIGDNWCAQEYGRNARFVADLAAPVVDLLDPRPGERILDLGCGDGALSMAIAARGADVFGVDGSADMVQAARARGLPAEVADGRHLSFSDEFDAVFSNAALHWMPDADSVAAGVARALKPNGRFVAEMGGHGNVAAIAVALRAVLGTKGPDASAIWFFPTSEHYARVLKRNGFIVQVIRLIPRPTVLPTGVAGWLATFSRPFLQAVAEPDRAALLLEVERLLAPSLRAKDGQWIADYVRLRFAARRA